MTERRMPAPMTEQESAYFELLNAIMRRLKDEHAGTEWKGVEECPQCGGRLHLFYADHHTMAQCETDQCVYFHACDPEQRTTAEFLRDLEAYQDRAAESEADDDSLGDDADARPGRGLTEQEKALYRQSLNVSDEDPLDDVRVISIS